LAYAADKASAASTGDGNPAPRTAPSTRVGTLLRKVATASEPYLIRGWLSKIVLSGRFDNGKSRIAPVAVGQQQPAGHAEAVNALICLRQGAPPPPLSEQI
jgi:hypothetical protein